MSVSKTPRNRGGIRLRPGRKRYEVRLRGADGRWFWRAAMTTDRRTAEQKKNEWQARIDRAEAGLVDPHQNFRAVPFQELIESFRSFLEDRGRAPKYVDNTVERLRVFATVARVRILADISPVRTEDFLGRLVRGVGLPATKRTGKGGSPVLRGAMGLRGRDGYVESLRRFGSFLVETGRCAVSPFAALRKVATEADRRMEHRAFSQSEVLSLVSAAEQRGADRYLQRHPAAPQEKVEQLLDDGWQRGTLYLFAAYTGLRLGECRQLNWSDLRLDSLKGDVRVRAKTAKNRREQQIPLLDSVKRRLIEHRQRCRDALSRTGAKDLSPDAKVFRIGLNLLAQFRKDAQFAGLGLKDEHGRTTTFHGLRATTATLLATAGVSPAVAMRILRHSDPRLTLKVYAKIDPLKDGHRELEKLDSADTQADTWSAPLAAAGHRSEFEDRSDQARRAQPQTPEVDADTAYVAAPRNSAPFQCEELAMVGPAGFEPAITES